MGNDDRDGSVLPFSRNRLFEGGISILNIIRHFQFAYVIYI